MATQADPAPGPGGASGRDPSASAGMPVESLAAALDGMLETEEGAARPLGDPREPDVIRTWVHLTAAVADDALDTAIEQAIAALAVDRPGRARLSAAGLIVGLPVQAALIGGYVRTFRRIKAIAAAGGLDDAAMMAETRRDLRALNQRMAEALGALRDQRAAMGRMNRILVDRERRQAGMNADLARAREDLEAARVVLARVEAERDEARRIADAARAERDTLRGDVKRARAGVEDLKAKYLEKFALSLHDLNQARAMLYNDPTSTLPAMKASVAQGYFMILEDMGAGEVARKLMAGIAKDGL